MTRVGGCSPVYGWTILARWRKNEAERRADVDFHCMQHSKAVIRNSGASIACFLRDPDVGWRLGRKRLRHWFSPTQLLGTCRGRRPKGEGFRNEWCNNGFVCLELWRSIGSAVVKPLLIGIVLQIFSFV